MNNYDQLQSNIFQKNSQNIIRLFNNLGPGATNIVYVEGIPLNAKEREVAHIFRPFPGFIRLRLIKREKNGQLMNICFVDFETIIQSTICIATLQGYRFDKRDLIGLHLSYGVKPKIN